MAKKMQFDQTQNDKLRAALINSIGAMAETLQAGGVDERLTECPEVRVALQDLKANDALLWLLTRDTNPL